MKTNQEAFDWMCEQLREVRSEMEQMRAEMETLKTKEQPMPESEMKEEELTLSDKKIHVIIPASGKLVGLTGDDTVCRAMNTLFHTFKTDEFSKAPLEMSVAHHDMFKIAEDSDVDIIVLVSLHVVVRSTKGYKHPPVMPILGNSDGSWYTGNAKVIIWPITLMSTEILVFDKSWEIDGHKLMIDRGFGTTQEGGLYYELRTHDGRLDTMLRELKKVLN